MEELARLGSRASGDKRDKATTTLWARLQSIAVKAKYIRDHMYWGKMKKRWRWRGGWRGMGLEMRWDWR